MNNQDNEQLVASRMPSQKVSFADKRANDYQWAKNTANYLIENAFFDDDIYSEMRTLYKVRDNILDEADYKHILNPFNFEGEKASKYTRHPAKLINFPLISPVIELMLSEYAKRPKICEVISVNPEVENEIRTQIKAIALEQYKQIFINRLNAQGIDTGEESVDEEQLNNEVQKKIKDLSESLSLQGQQSIDYLKYDLDLIDNFLDGVNDWLTVGRIITYKDVHFDDVLYTVIPPTKVYFEYRSDVKYIEDLDSCVFQDYWSLSKILDYFREDLTDDQIEELEKLDTTFDRLGNFNPAFNNGQIFAESYRSFDDSGIQVSHATWKAYKKVGKLIYLNQLGQIQETEVEESYKFEPELGDLYIEWHWINETWETWRLGESPTSAIFLRTRPTNVQRNEISNISKCKLPYNGRVRRSRTGSLNSVVKLGLPFAFTYNYVNFNFQKTINNNKNKVMFFPKGLIPSGPGWDTDKFIYFITSLGFGLYDETAPNAIAALQGIKQVDLSTADLAYKTYELLQLIKQEFWDAIGMNRQRYGDVSGGDGKGVTEQAIFRSAMISEEMYRELDKLFEKDLNGLLDVSKVAWIEGKKGKYLNSEQREIFLNIIGPQHLSTDYSVFVKNGDAEQRKFDELRTLFLPMLQNNVPASLVAEAIDSDNINKLKRLMEEYDDTIAAYQQAAQQIQQEEAKAKQEEATAKLEIEKYAIDKKFEADIYTADLQFQGKLITSDTEEGDDDTLAREKLRIDNENKTADRKQKDAHHKDKMSIERQKINKSKN